MTQNFRSPPARRSKPGPKSSVNLLAMEVEDVAEAIKLRLMGTTCPMTVHVSDSGDVMLERANDPRRAYELPVEWLLGTYTRKAKCDDIEDDLVVRWHELRPGRRGDDGSVRASA